MEKGESYWVSAHEQQAIAAGQMIVVPPTVGGVLRASQIGPVTVHHFQFCVCWLAGLLTLPERQALDQLAQSFPTVQAFNATHSLSRRFAALAFTSNDTPFLNRCRLVELAAEALVGNLTEETVSPDNAIFACERFQELVTRHTEREILQSPVEKLAQFCNCSTRHLRALFRKHFGVSLKARQTRMRLCDAADRLGETDIAIEVLAQECGYRYTRSFAIAFKREFGCTPADWRQSHGGREIPPKSSKAGEILTQS